MKKTCCPGSLILKVAKKVQKWTPFTLSDNHTSQPRLMLHGNNFPRPPLAFGFTFLILAQPSAWAPSQLWFLFSSLVPNLHGVPAAAAASNHSSINPALLRPTILLLPWNNRELNLLYLLEDRFSLSGYTLPISLTIFRVTPSTGLVPVWLLYSQDCFLKQEILGRVV